MTKKKTTTKKPYENPRRHATNRDNQTTAKLEPPYRSGPALTAADIRDIIKSELATARSEIVSEVVELLKPAQAEAERDPFSLEAPMPSVEREAYAPVLSAYELRKEAGMSPALAEVLSKIEQGIDPTPLQCGFPPGKSYFYDAKVEGSDGARFQALFIKLLKDGLSVTTAYIDTCHHFNLPTNEKADPRERILKELPDRAGGAFALGRGEAAERFGAPAQLGSGKDK